MKLVDEEKWALLEQPVGDYLSGEINGGNVIAAIGAQSCGKSSLLNILAGANVFRTHVDLGEEDNLLQHVTLGVDVHITNERMVLLDTQVLSLRLLVLFNN